MTEAVQNYETLKTDVASAAKAHNEPQWLVDHRVAAIDDLVDLGFPNMQRFQYSDWTLTPTDEPLEFKDSDKSLADSVPFADDRIQFVQAGQTTVAVNLPDDLKQQGVILTDLFTALHDHAELVEKYLFREIKLGEDRLTSYHAAYLNSGLFLYVPKGVVIEKPIEAYLIQDSTRKQPMVSHVLIVADNDSKFSYIQHMATVGDVANAASAAVEMVAKPNSEVHFSSLDELGENTTSYLKRRANIGDNATVDWAIGLMNDGKTVGDFDSELIGKSSKADSKVIAVTSGEQREGINNRVTNHGKRSTGFILQRGVLLKKSELVFNGIGDIIHGASGANAEQENRVLMMSNEAHGDANPILLIDENDVLAGHAASVGQVDQEQMYYLMSRGIARPTAQRMVIRGFLSAVIGAVPLPEVRQQMIDILERKLEDGQQLE